MSIQRKRTRQIVPTLTDCRTHHACSTCWTKSLLQTKGPDTLLFCRHWTWSIGPMEHKTILGLSSVALTAIRALYGLRALSKDFVAILPSESVENTAPSIVWFQRRCRAIVSLRQAAYTLQVSRYTRAVAELSPDPLMIVSELHRSHANTCVACRCYNVQHS
jgi:hypothetical protein